MEKLPKDSRARMIVEKEETNHYQITITTIGVMTNRPGITAHLLHVRLSPLRGTKIVPLNMLAKLFGSNIFIILDIGWLKAMQTSMLLFGKQVTIRPYSVPTKDMVGMHPQL